MLAAKDPSLISCIHCNRIFKHARKRGYHETTIAWDPIGVFLGDVTTSCPARIQAANVYLKRGKGKEPQEHPPVHQSYLGQAVYGLSSLGPPDPPSELQCRYCSRLAVDRPWDFLQHGHLVDLRIYPCHENEAEALQIYLDCSESQIYWICVEQLKRAKAWVFSKAFTDQGYPAPEVTWVSDGKGVYPRPLTEAAHRVVRDIYSREFPHLDLSIISVSTPPPQRTEDDGGDRRTQISGATDGEIDRGTTSPAPATASASPPSSSQPATARADRIQREATPSVPPDDDGIRVRPMNTSSTNTNSNPSSTSNSGATSNLPRTSSNDASTSSPLRRGLSFSSDGVLPRIGVPPWRPKTPPPRLDPRYAQTPETNPIAPPTESPTRNNANAPRESSGSQPSVHTSAQPSNSSNPTTPSNLRTPRQAEHANPRVPRTDHTRTTEYQASEDFIRKVREWRQRQNNPTSSAAPVEDPTMQRGPPNPSQPMNPSGHYQRFPNDENDPYRNRSGQNPYPPVPENMPQGDVDYNQHHNRPPPPPTPNSTLRRDADYGPYRHQPSHQHHSSAPEYPSRRDTDRNTFSTGMPTATAQAPPRPLRGILKKTNYNPPTAPTNQFDSGGTRTREETSTLPSKRRIERLQALTSHLDNVLMGYRQAAFATENEVYDLRQEVAKKKKLAGDLAWIVDEMKDLP
ncbi:hypothetical protein BT69DRAFT_284502 [Atractiella rhizophila]|nr:hypothetical protein BT69DRAFT_284502 [Atractiella rhizophila]